MTEFDTSGVVALPGGEGMRPYEVVWSDLSPFTQGYVEALFASFLPRYDPEPGMGAHELDPPAFSDLAPETLARIIADCADVVTLYGLSGAEDGPEFWASRNQPVEKGDTLFRQAYALTFPPLTVQLGDDGKVRFA